MYLLVKRALALKYLSFSICFFQLKSLILSLQTFQATYDFYGLVAPVFTPLDEDGVINYDVIPKYTKYLAKQNITGILGNLFGLLFIFKLYTITNNKQGIIINYIGY